MYRQLESYENANMINQFYIEGLKSWSIYGTNKSKAGRVNAFVLNPEMIIQMEINEIAFFFATHNQYIENAIKNNPSYEEGYIELLSEIGVGKHFESKKETDKKQFFHDIRNALAHANYKPFVKLELDSALDSYIYIENDKVKGKLKLKQLLEIQKKYKYIKESLDRNEEMIANTDPITSLKTNNKKNYKEAIDSLRLAKFKSNLTTDSILLLSIPELSEEYFSFMDTKELTEKQKKIIKNYIDYIGLKKWNSIKQEAKIIALGIITKYCFNNKVRLQNDAMNLTRYIAIGAYSESMQDGLAILAPFHYTNLLMQYSFYCLNTYKERAKQINIEDLLYTSSELSKINFIDLYDCDKDEIENQLIEKLKNEKEKLKNSQENKEKQIKGIMESTKLTNEEKIKKLQERREELDKTSNTLKEVEKKLTELKEKQGNYGDYLSSPEFFDRLRNSISHDYYEIDYQSGLKSKNLENMTIRFYDQNDKRIVFDFKIRAGDLISLFDTLLVKVKEESPHYKKEKTQASVVINKSTIATDKQAKQISIKISEELVDNSKHTIVIHNPNSEKDIIRGRKK